MQAIQISDCDNVAVALEEIAAGAHVEAGGTMVKTTGKIPAGHKLALCAIARGEAIVKYGSRIGIALADIRPGAWVHTHNMKTALDGKLAYSYEPQKAPEAPSEPLRELYFNGYSRSDGSVGVRNEIWIIPTVGCVNGVVKQLEAIGQRFVSGSVEGVFAFPHPYGCSQLGEDQENTRKLLAALVRHPNAGGVLVVGLGCENSGIEVLKKYIGDYDENRVKFLNCQDCSDELSEGEKLLKQLAELAGSAKREQVSTKKLIVGLKCGGSDGLSGITANPLVGRFSDILTAHGGTTILTEVPEMFGAETLLMNRACNREVFDKTVAMVNGFKDYFSSAGLPIYENPSPGNKAGGISTLEDKSLGCTQKSGSGSVNAVLSYGERTSCGGLNLLCAPGNDLVASTALAASGAQIVLFTTGRGTPFGCPVPTVKISSNTGLAERKSCWIDFNAGVIAEGRKAEDFAGLLVSYVLEVASGKRVKSELSGYHDMAIFKNGVTL